MQLPPITKKQKEIIIHLYAFRFLTTHHIQQLFGHKNPNRSLAWLKYLIENNYVRRLSKRKSFVDNTKPAIYFLGTNARQVLQKEKKLAAEEMEYIYQEHRRKPKFIDHCLFIAGVYLYLVSQKESHEELTFFTSNELRRYVYFPDPLPDAFISIKSLEGTRRYFLDYFDPYIPPFVLRNRIRMYLEYAEQSDWDEMTDHTPLPFVLFICPNTARKKHLFHYAKALLEKTAADTFSFFFTTKAQIIAGKTEYLWEKVTAFEE